MPKSGETRAVREVKEAMAKAKAKRTKAVDNLSTDTAHRQPSEVANQDAPIGNQEGLHRQPHWQPPEVARTQEEHIEKDIKDKDRHKVNDCLRNLDVSDFDFLIDAGMKPEQVEQYASTLLPLYQAEGLNPSSRVLADSILQMHRDVR